MARLPAAVDRHRPGRDGAIAQLGERVVRNDEVGGSIPPGSTTLRPSGYAVARLRTDRRTERARHSPQGDDGLYLIPHPRDPFPRAKYACVSGRSSSQPLQRLNTLVMRSGSTPS